MIEVGHIRTWRARGRTNQVRGLLSIVGGVVWCISGAYGGHALGLLVMVGGAGLWLVGRVQEWID